MGPNWYILFVAALVPMVIGFIWYNPKVFGTAWMKVASMTEEKIKSGNMPLIFGLSYLLSVLLSFALAGIVIHQLSLFSLFNHYPEFADQMAKQSGERFEQFVALNQQFEGMFRDWKHGLLHGIFAGITFALPVLATNSMFERKGFKYVAVNGGYWIITLGVMGAIICQFL